MKRETGSAKDSEGTLLFCEGARKKSSEDREMLTKGEKTNSWHHPIYVLMPDWDQFFLEKVST
jgi:hypothetical protein